MTSFLLQKSDIFTLILKRNATFLSCLSLGEECIPMNVQISQDPRSHDPEPGPKEKSMTERCASFETEYTLLVGYLPTP